MITDDDVKEIIKRVRQFLDENIVQTQVRLDLWFMVGAVEMLAEGKMIASPLPPDKRMEHMTEPELSAHLTRQLRFIKACQSEDTVGSMLIIFQEDKITQYGATCDPETAPQALRELADRIERRETVER